MWRWLSLVLERIVSGKTTIDRLDTLLTWTWKAARAAEPHKQPDMEAQAA